MKILIDLTSLADNFSGIERFASCLSLELVKRKEHDFILLFKESFHPLFRDFLSEPNVKTIVLPRCGKFVFNQFRLPLAIYGIKADCYLFLAFPVPVLLFKRNMISTIHDICCWDCPETMNHASNLYFGISHRVAKLKCKAIVTISRFSESRILDKLRLARDRLWLIYCGIEERFFAESNAGCAQLVRKKYNLPENYILSLSTLEPRKNLSILIQAYRQLVLEGDISVPLVLAGRIGWKTERLLDGIENTIKQRILFTGFVDDEDLPAVYSNANFFVFPSQYEGFGIPPLEAMASGTPVLSSDATSLPEILGEHAVYFESNNVSDLCNKMRMLLLSSSGQDRCAQKQHARKYNWSEQAAILLDHIQTLSETT